MDSLCLSDIKCGQSAVVLDIDKKSPLKRRLMDIGIIKGTRVYCVGKSPFCDPIALLIRGAVIAIRKDDLSYISARLLEEGEHGTFD